MSNKKDNPENPENPDEPASGDETPDVGFSLSDGDKGSTPPPGDSAAAAGAEEPGESRDRALAREIADALAEAAPEGWQRLDAAFALTTTTGNASVVYSDRERSMRSEPAGPVLEQVRRHRALVAELEDEPWWRLLIRLTSEGEFDADYDYGDEPFPDEQLFSPEAYRADLEEYPRDVLPVWLGAHIGHDGRQQRSPQDAARQARADAAAKVWPLMGQPAGPEQRAAAASLISAAEVGVVTRETVEGLFDDPERFDIDGAMFQFSIAGLVASIPERMPEDEAIFRVRTYIEGRGLDTTGYPLDQLVADRFSCGWMVYVPVPRGEIAIGRAIFYIADDGELEHSSSSIAPTTFVKDFEQRFQERQEARV